MTWAECLMERVEFVLFGANGTGISAPHHLPTPQKLSTTLFRKYSECLPVKLKLLIEPLRNYIRTYCAHS